MPTTENRGVALEWDAYKSAFRAGQLLERLLLERAQLVARDAGTEVVVEDHVWSCLDESLLDDLRTHFDEPAGPEGESRAA